jgi:hypothetical protein
LVLKSATVLHLPPGEHLYVYGEGGPIIFIKGDRPQQYFGRDICLVRNHRFEGIYFLRTNHVVRQDIIEMIAANMVRQRPIEERNRVYLDKKVFKRENVIGINIGVYVDETESPLPIYFSPRGIELYNRAMLVSSSPHVSGMGSFGVPGRSPFSSSLKQVQFHNNEPKDDER